MFKSVTPESVGISSKDVLDFFKRYDAYGYATHSVIMARGNKIFAEMYYAPFDKDFKHRMYSVSKSFVAVAIGLCEEMGLLSLDDKMVKFFPEYELDDINENMKEMTIRDMLTMSTCVSQNKWWLNPETKDRTEFYFTQPCKKIAGTSFQYDSSGSYMLGVIVEKLTKKPFLEFLKEKIFAETDFSKDATCIKCPGGHSFSDSGVLCTARDLLTFARFVMDKGVINGKRHLNSKFLEEATKRQVDNELMAVGENYDCHGYGYQIWKSQNDGFVFSGMGDQFAICDPKTDFVFIINSNNQGTTQAATILFHELYNNIIPNLGEPLEENEKDYKELSDYMNSRELVFLNGDKTSPVKEKINNVTYKLSDNPMKIEYIRLNFRGDVGILSYKNAYGEKELCFGMGYNELGKFPQKGCPDMEVTVPEKDNMYDCAASAEWSEEKKLKIKVQIIDKYFGSILMVFGFKDNRVGVYMRQVFEGFFSEYSGFAYGQAVNESEV